MNQWPVNGETAVRQASYPRWLMMLLVLLAAAALAGGAWFYQSQKRFLQQNAEIELQAIARLKVNQIIAWRSERLANATVLMKNPLFLEGVARWTASPHAESSQALTVYLRLLQEYYNYSDVLLMDADGQLRLSVKKRSNPLDIEQDFRL